MTFCLACLGTGICIVLPYVCLDDFKEAEWPRFGIRIAH